MSASKKSAEFGYHSSTVKRDDLQKWVEVDLKDSVDASQIILHACHDEFGGIGAGFGFPVRYQVAVEGEEGGMNIVYDRLQADVANPGLEPVVIDLGGRKIRRVRVTATKLAHRKNDYIFALGEVRVSGC